MHTVVALLLLSGSALGAGCSRAEPPAEEPKSLKSHNLERLGGVWVIDVARVKKFDRRHRRQSEQAIAEKFGNIFCEFTESEFRLTGLPGGDVVSDYTFTEATGRISMALVSPNRLGDVELEYTDLNHMTLIATSDKEKIVMPFVRRVLALKKGAQQTGMSNTRDWSGER